MSFFRRWTARPEPQVEETPEQRLIAAYDALDQERRDGVAQQLSVLWAWFIEEFGGPGAFTACPDFEQEAYLAKLDMAARRSEPLKDGDLGRYYFSSALLRCFVNALRTQDTSADALAVSDRVAWLIERGRQLGQKRRGS